MSRHVWTTKQEEFLRANYPEKGGRFCSDFIGCTMDAVHMRAAKLGIRTKHVRGVPFVAGYDERRGPGKKFKRASKC